MLIIPGSLGAGWGGVLPPPGCRLDTARTSPERCPSAARTPPGRCPDAAWMPLWALLGRRRRRLQNGYKTSVKLMNFVCFRGRLEPVWEAWRRCPGGVRTSSGQRSDSAQAASGRRRIRRQPTPATYKNHWFYTCFISVFKPASMATRRHPGRRSGGVRVASGRRPNGVQVASW